MKWFRNKLDPVIRDEYLFVAGILASIFMATFAVTFGWPPVTIILSLAPAGLTGTWLLSGD